MSRTLALSIGCLLSLVVLVHHVFDVIDFGWMVFFLIVFIAIVLGKIAFNEHKTMVMALWTHMRLLISALPTLPLFFHRGGKRSDEWKLQINHMVRNLTTLSKELSALSDRWHTDRKEYFKHNLQEEPALTPTEPHQTYWSEFYALTKSLTHLGTPANDARLELEDLNFYCEWLGDLTDRFHAFEQQYIQQESKVKRALSDAQAVHHTFARDYQPEKRHRGYWIASGSYATLEALLKEGCIQPASLLPKMQSLQIDMEVLFDKERFDLRQRTL